MEAPNPAAQADTQVQVAEAKAELAVVLTESFREDINGLRDALQHANQLIDSLRTENANLKAALASADPDHDFEALEDAPRADDEPLPAANNNNKTHPTAATATTTQARLVPTSPRGPHMQQVPPEGTIFSNGGPYKGLKNGERANNNARLKQEISSWTRARGYEAKIYRSRLEKKRAKLIISCVFAGSPKYRAGRLETAAEEKERRDKAQETGGHFRKQRVSKLLGCPLRFTLLEIVEGSGTFVVKHSLDPSAQRCNHEPNPPLGHFEETDSDE